MSGYVVCRSVDGRAEYLLSNGNWYSYWTPLVEDAYIWHNIGDARRAAAKAGVSVDCVERLSCVVPV